VDSNLKERVSMLLACGVEPEKAAAILAIPYTDFQDRFAFEVDTAEQLANAKVAKSLYKMATSGKHPQASIFWLKSRADWTEQTDLHIETDITGFRFIDDEGEGDEDYN